VGMEFRQNAKIYDRSYTRHPHAEGQNIPAEFESGDRERYRAGNPNELTP